MFCFEKVVFMELRSFLLGSKQSISEIAYELGVEYPQHFSKVFKSKTGMSPRKYRNANLALVSNNGNH